MVQLVPMNEAEFEMYLEYTIQEYAQEQASGGKESEEEAVGDGERQYHQLLPQGLQTPDHSLCMIVDSERGKRVGILWYDRRDGENGQQVYIDDLVIFEEFRRRGYARKAIEQLEKHARELGVKSIGLQIIGQNEAAHALYERLKYVVADMNAGMSKNLS